jgi:hypothetical protein
MILVCVDDLELVISFTTFLPQIRLCTSKCIVRIGSYHAEQQSLLYRGVEIGPEASPTIEVRLSLFKS